jgi:hypothetical protein
MELGLIPQIRLENFTSQMEWFVPIEKRATAFKNNIRV